MLAGMMIALLVLGRQLLAAVPRLASGAPAVAEPEE